MKNIAAIFAGGVGNRMGSSIPKQFLEIYGKSIIIHTLEKFQYNPNIDLIYVGCKEEYIPLLIEQTKRYGITKIPKEGILPGGESGQDTIYRVLKRIEEHNSKDDIVLIHDGVRPLIDDGIINKCIETTKKYGNAITCAKNVETPVYSENGITVEKTPNRDYMYVAKAPQCFHLSDILEAHDIIREKYPNYENSQIVDSCTLMRSVGKEVHIVNGNRSNIKVTTTDDYINLLSKMTAEDYMQLLKLTQKGEN